MMHFQVQLPSCLKSCPQQNCDCPLGTGTWPLRYSYLHLFPKSFVVPGNLYIYYYKNILGPFFLVNSFVHIIKSTTSNIYYLLCWKVTVVTVDWCDTHTYSCLYCGSTVFFFLSVFPPEPCPHSLHTIPVSFPAPAWVSICSSLCAFPPSLAPFIVGGSSPPPPGSCYILLFSRS